ncbi:duf580 domain-containing protein [Xylariomycetidae sp. FL0641]|nr:duf580 domain-containing protein [Xylariomycetidae sp. FL0641]
MASNQGEAASYYSQSQHPLNAPPSNGQSQYAPNQPPAQGPAGYSNGYGNEKPMFDQAFKVDRPKYNDLWAAILFLLTCAGFVAVSGLSLHGYADSRNYEGGGIYDSSSRVGLNTNTIILFLFCLMVALVFSWGYVMLARMFPKAFIWVTGILNIVFGLVTAIYMLYRHYWSGGIVFLIFVAFMIFCFITWIPRIPFSALMLKTAVDVSKSYGHVYLVSLLAGLLATALAAWYSITFVAVYAKYAPGNNPGCSAGGGGCSQAKVIGLLVFITFAMYWISEVLKNVTHVAVSGVYGSWYFFGKQNQPRAVTRGALRRALTTSFGSISLGSLLVAIINFLRQICSVARQNEAAQGDICGSVMFCVLGCFIGILDWAVQFLNRYAFSYIALYGKPYFAAAKDTWTMIKQRGIDALINECLLGPVFSFGATFVAYACDGSYTPVVVAFAFLIGLQICHVFTTPLSSGIDTIFVASAWEPHILMQNHPDLYDAMVRVYPQVQTAIHA